MNYRGGKASDSDQLTKNNFVSHDDEELRVTRKVCYREPAKTAFHLDRVFGLHRHAPCLPTIGMTVAVTRPTISASIGYRTLRMCCPDCELGIRNNWLPSRSHQLQTQLHPENNSVDEDRVANLGVSHALNIMDKRNARKSDTPGRDAAMLRLTAMSRAKGVSENELARQAGLDGSIIRKLDLRRLTEIPWLCFERLAATLRASVDLIRPLITGPPIMEAGVRYKAKTKPRPVTESFADAIRSSSLAEPDKQFWLEVAERERRNK